MTAKNANQKERIQIVLPADIARSLREQVAAGERSAFVAEAIERQLLVASRLDAIERAYGAWSDDDYPLLNTPEDISVWRDALWTGKDPNKALEEHYAAKKAKRDLATSRRANRKVANAKIPTTRKRRSA